MQQRVIKFRAWMKGAEMQYRTLREVMDNGFGLPYGINEDVKVMQFTGLYDRNGKECFEGDRVRYHLGGAAANDQDGVVQYKEDWGCFIIFNNYFIGFSSVSSFEIIGNIYEQK